MFTKEYYTDFYGCTASITHQKLHFVVVVKSRQGETILCKGYDTHRGAMIALGKVGDCWKLDKIVPGKVKIKL